MTISPGQRLRRYFASYGIWLFMTLLTLLPIWWMFVVSMRSRVELFGRPNLSLTRLYMENYSNVLTDSSFQRYMTNSVVISTSNAVLVMALALLATYALSRYKLTGRDNIFLLADYQSHGGRRPPFCCRSSSCSRALFASAAGRSMTRRSA